MRKERAEGTTTRATTDDWSMETYRVEPRTLRPTIENCIVIKLPQLKRLGMLKRGWLSRRYIAFYDGRGRYAGALTFVSDIECHELSPCLRITGSAYGLSVDQRILLESMPMRYGGDRWYASCPLTEKRCTTLVLPRGEREFASMAGWNVAYASQRLGTFRRMLHALDKAEERLEGLSKYTRLPTRRRHREKITSLIFALAAQVNGE